jgi:hypothetical protein
MRVALLLAVCILGCGRNSRPTPTEAPPAPTPIPPTVFQRVEVTTVTTGARLDTDGYSIENDPWDYGEGDGMTAKLPTNGTVVLSLTAGTHVLYLFDVAKNCTGVNLDRSINVQAGTVTSVIFTLVCADS